MANVIYANARAKAKEVALITKDRFNRMIEAKDHTECLKILTESGFGSNVAVNNALDFELLLNEEIVAFNKFVKESSPSKELETFLLAKNDYHNALALIRAKHLKIDATKLKTADGRFSFAEMKEKVMADDYSAFPKEMAKALLKIDLMFVDKSANGENTDNVIKTAYYTELENAVKKVKELNQIFSYQADCTNILLSFRYRDYTKAEALYVKGGSLGLADLKALCEESSETIMVRYKFHKLSKEILSAVESYQASSPYDELELLSDNYPLTLLKKNKYSVEGMYPYMLYCFYKLAEIKNARIIMVGKINSISEEQIKKMVRDSYE